jgi:hypothetical protein
VSYLDIVGDFGLYKIYKCKLHVIEEKKKIITGGAVRALGGTISFCGVASGPRYEGCQH